MTSVDADACRKQLNQMGNTRSGSLSCSVACEITLATYRQRSLQSRTGCVGLLISSRSAINCGSESRSPPVLSWHSCSSCMFNFPGGKRARVWFRVYSGSKGVIIVKNAPSSNRAGLPPCTPTGHQVQSFCPPLRINRRYRGRISSEAYRQTSIHPVTPCPYRKMGVNRILRCA